MPALQVPATAAEADSLIASGACVVNFCATWAEPCAHLNTVFAELAREHEHLSFVQVDADAFPELCERFSLEAVPAFLFLHSGKLADSVLGADVPSLVNKVKQHNHTSAITKAPAVPATAASSGSATGDAMDISESQPTASLEDRLKALTSQAPVVLFMKGDPETPRCGFSRQAVELLRGAKVQFATFDILNDEEVRQGLKAFSNWPTYPQLYGDGKLLGGLDIMKELQEEGELASSLPAAAKVVPLEDRLKALTSQAPVVLFMKGDPETPRCGFSRQAVELLRGAKVQFATFDILNDEEVRQGLKAFSNWPTYPQLYGDGKLLGGLDIMKELQEEGELASSLPAAAVNASGA